MAPRFLTPTFVLLFVLLPAARARAASIVIVRPAAASPALTETVSRVHGELLSLGLDVSFTEPAAGPAPDPSASRARLEPIATARHADVVIEIGAALHPTADIYVLDRRTGRSELSRISVEPDAPDRPARLAIRTIEAVRSGLVELDLVARGRPQPLAVRAEPAAPASPAVPERLAVEAGAAVLTGVDGVGPALLPTLRVGWATRYGLAVEVAAAGFGSRPVLTAPAGSARVAQQFGLVGVSTAVPSKQWIRPYAALAAGVLRTAIDGQADAPAQAHDAERWSFLLDGSIGARVRLPGTAFVALGLHVQVAAPYVAVHISDTVVATTGRPNVLCTLTVGAWL